MTLDHKSGSRDIAEETLRRQAQNARYISWYFGASEKARQARERQAQDAARSAMVTYKDSYGDPDDAARNLRCSWRIGITGILAVLCLVAMGVIWMSVEVIGWTP